MYQGGGSCGGKNVRRMLWKTVIDVYRFYKQECTPEMFEHGQGPIPWPAHTKLSFILLKFLDGDEMKRRLFLDEVPAEFYRKQLLNDNAGGYQGRGGLGGKKMGVACKAPAATRVWTGANKDTMTGDSAQVATPTTEEAATAHRGPSCLPREEMWEELSRTATLLRIKKMMEVYWQNLV